MLPLLLQQQFLHRYSQQLLNSGCQPLILELTRIITVLLMLRIIESDITQQQDTGNSLPYLLNLLVGESDLPQRFIHLGKVLPIVDSLRLLAGTLLQKLVLLILQ